MDDDDSTSATGSRRACCGPPSPATAGDGRRRRGAGRRRAPSEWELEFGGTTDVVDVLGERAGLRLGRPPCAGPCSGAGNGTRTRSPTAAASEGDGQERSDTAPAGNAPPPVPGRARSAAAAVRGRRASTQQAGDGLQADDGQQGGDQGRGEQGEHIASTSTSPAPLPPPPGRRGKDDQTHVEEFAGEAVEVEGLLDLREEGYGFLRVKGYLPSKDDIYVSVKQVRQFGLRKGITSAAPAAPPCATRRTPPCCASTGSTAPTEQARKRRRFEDLTPLFPDKLTLETANDASNMTARIVDLIALIGKGQRGLIVSPPRRARRPSSSRSPARSRPTTPRSSSWCCWSTSGRKR